MLVWDQLLNSRLKRLNFPSRNSDLTGHLDFFFYYCIQLINSYLNLLFTDNIQCLNHLLIIVYTLLLNHPLSIPLNPEIKYSSVNPSSLWNTMYVLKAQIQWHRGLILWFNSLQIQFICPFPSESLMSQDALPPTLWGTDYPECELHCSCTHLAAL